LAIEEDIKQQLSRLPETTVLYLNTDTPNYYRAMLVTVDHLVNTLHYGGVYISSTRPVNDIKIQMEASGISTSDLYFVDSVVYLVGGKGVEERTVFVESPAMLESIMLKLDWQLKQVRAPVKFVFFDSINGLAVYNEEKLLMEFIHVFTNNMRLRDIYTVLMSVREQTPEKVDSILKLTCDDVLEVERKPEKGVDFKSSSNSQAQHKVGGKPEREEGISEEEREAVDAAEAGVKDSEGGGY